MPEGAAPTRPSPEARRDRRHAETREEILAAAWALAERDGIAGVSLRDVARQVGMRAPSLYTYFDSKGAIYDAMFAQGYEALDEELDAIGPDLAGVDPVVGLGRVLDGFVSFCQSSVPRYQLMFTRAIADWEPSAEAYARSVVSYGRMLEQLASFGITDPEVVDLCTAISAGLAAQQVANDLRGDRWRRLSTDAARMLVTHLERR